MCIICTRCVRACDDLRHTTAITLAGRGFSTRIAFGAGGRVDESNCDFCGACIDVCPTATLMESPNKWVARPDRWVNTTCTECAMGCSIQLGVKNGRGVIVKPGSGNDVSRDQICVRGRFGYDQVRDKDRLHMGRLGRGADTMDAEPAMVIQDAARRLAAIIREHGAESVGLLGSGQATNEDNYLLRQLAAFIDTPHLDSSAGQVYAPVEAALEAAFGSDHLPNRLTDIEVANTLVVIADDLPSSNNVLGVRVKDAVVQHGARLITVSQRGNPLEDFVRDPALALRPERGDTAATVQALVTELLKDQGLRARASATEGLKEGLENLPPVRAPGAAEAAQALLSGEAGTVAVVLAPSRVSGIAAGAQARAAANLAIVLAGPDAAAASLHVLPPEANTLGLRDMGVMPGPDGLDLLGMLAAARAGTLRALIIAKDNPLLLLPERASVRASLEALDLLLVIDDIATDTVQAATHVLPDVAVLAKDGSVTNADRQILRLHAATRPTRAAQSAGRHLQDLATQLAKELQREPPPVFQSSADVMDAIAAEHPLYAQAQYSRLLRALRQASNGATAQAFQTVEPASAPAQTAGSGLVLVATRDLSTDRSAAALRLADADRLHRGEFLEMHPGDAAARNIADGAAVQVRTDAASITTTARVSDAITAGTVLFPILWDGGAVQDLLRADAAVTAVEVSAL